ncbi:MAG: glycosyltransferase family 2 protein [Acidimicrobiia bacterium]|nr:glycosyltransferase family 2 protein [Acidimicrobiia bacterium]
MTLGILTYQRPEGLRRTLASIDDSVVRTVAPPWRIDDVIIIDNDRHPSAEAIVEEVRAAGHPLPLVYYHEPEPGLAAARNRALDEARGRVLVFIDDDESAGPGWPGGLLATMSATGAALVGGPVRTIFTADPPGWIGALFDRPEPDDGAAQPWLRSGNLAIDLGAIRREGLRFDPAYAASGGEDVAFSWAARLAGLRLAWSATAIVEEHVGPERTIVRWVTTRERSSTANWVRIETAHHPGLARRFLIAGRGIARFAQGAMTASAGALTLDSARAVRGLVIASRGIGSFQGLARRGGVSYHRS